MKRSIHILIVSMAVSSPVMGDGIYLPEAAYPTTPSIPTQRALITFRNGVETLVVESSYQTDSPSVGWILPLPAEPTKLDQADSGLLLSLSMCLRPRISHDFSTAVKGIGLLGACLVPLALIVILVRDPRRRVRLESLLLVLIVYGVLFGGMLLPTLSKAGGDGGGTGSVPGVTEVQSQRIGNYQATVLKATDGKAVSAWLEANSLKGLDEKAKAIVDDYVARKWCFLVARLRKAGTGLATPHPIAATFSTDSIVYPLKLTALAGSDTRVELFVVTDSQAAASGFECVAADRFDKVASYVGRGDPSYSSGPIYRSKSTGLTIGSPDAGEFLWPGCVVTRLVADLKPQQMAQDVAIRPEALSPYRKHVFSSTGRRHIVAATAMGGAILLLFGAMFAFRGRRRPKKKHLLLFGVPAVVILLACMSIHFFLPVVPVRTGRHLSPVILHLHMADLRRSVESLVSNGLLSAQMSQEELAEFPELIKEHGKLLHEGGINPFTGRKMRFERSPGNFSVRRIDGQTYLCFYDDNCSEYRVSLSGGEP